MELHTGCLDHVCLAVGAVYCPRTRGLYCNPLMLGAGLFSHQYFSGEDVDKCAAILYMLQREWPHVHIAEFSILNKLTTMPGMDGTGMEPHQHPRFSMEAERGGSK